MSEPIPDWWDKIQKAYAQQGHIVISAVVPLRFGHVVKFADVPGSDGNHTRMLDQPFVVTGTATRDEFIAQSKLIGWDRLGEPDAPSWGHYYRATTD